MLALEAYQYLLISLIFIWSGFVRAGLGFGGAALSLPFILLVDNRPIVYLPIIAIHLLFFSSLTVAQGYLKRRKTGTDDQQSMGGVDWTFLKYALSIMIVPKLIGVMGLITLPDKIMSIIIFSVVIAYSLCYVFNKTLKSSNKTVDTLFLILGGYVSGTSLIGAPLITAVFANKVSKFKLRDTLFALWFILVSIKMAAYIYADVSFHWLDQLWLLPAVVIGHIAGLRFHDRLLHTDPKVFYRVLGVVLLVVSIVGLWIGLRG